MEAKHPSSASSHLSSSADLGVSSLVPMEPVSWNSGSELHFIVMEFLLICTQSFLPIHVTL